MSDNKVKVLDVGWFNDGEHETPFNFYIEVVINDKKATIHSVAQYKSRSGATRAAHDMIKAFGWDYKNNDS